MTLRDESTNTEKRWLTGFTKKYKTSKLVYYEVFEDIENAIAREKQIKGYLRQKKVRLIESANKEWQDLYEGLVTDAARSGA